MLCGRSIFLESFAGKKDCRDEVDESNFIVVSAD